MESRVSFQYLHPVESDFQRQLSHFPIQKKTTTTKKHDSWINYFKNVLFRPSLSSKWHHETKARTSVFTGYQQACWYKNYYNGQGVNFYATDFSRAVQVCIL